MVDGASGSLASFVARYDLPISDVSLRLWNACNSAASRLTNPSGASKRSEQSKRTEPTPFERAFGTDPVLLKVNPPGAIRDAWR
jgi:hypothetical protein